MTTAAQDLDGNGTLNESDRFGMTCINGVSLAMLHSAGESAISLKDGVPVISTLDDKLVDTVMDVLGKLGKSFAVGLISHVEELKRRIENKIVVTGANERHGSLVRVESYS